MCKDSPCNRYPLCHCNHETPLRLEVGKTYLNGSGQEYKILFKDGSRYVCQSCSHDTAYVWYYSDGKYGGGSPRDEYKGTHWNLVKEYKPPVVHERDIVWYQWDKDTSIVCASFAKGYKLCSPCIELHRQTVTYTEESGS